MICAAKLDNVSLKTGRKLIINDLAVELQSGITGLLGPNGAGKTTLMRILATLLRPTEGEIYISGKRIVSEKDARIARRRIGYLPQKLGFFPSFTANEFVRYCGWLKGMSDPDAKAQSARVLDAVDMTEHADSKLKALSGGMIQRVGIAQAMVTQPELLLLDEPTAGLDPQQRNQFRSIIRSLGNTTVLISTHLTDDVAAVCDAVIVLDRGSSLFQGGLHELVRRGSSHDERVSDLDRGYLALLGDPLDSPS